MFVQHQGDTKERGKIGEKTAIVHSFFLLLIIYVLNTQTLLLVRTVTVTSVKFPGPSGEVKGRKECFGILTLLFIIHTSFQSCSCADFKYDEFW